MTTEEQIFTARQEMLNGRSAARALASNLLDALAKIVDAVDRNAVDEAAAAAREARRLTTLARGTRARWKRAAPFELRP